jgi:hypothetical protein
MWRIYKNLLYTYSFVGESLLPSTWNLTLSQAAYLEALNLWHVDRLAQQKWRHQAYLGRFWWCHVGWLAQSLKVSYYFSIRCLGFPVRHSLPTWQFNPNLPTMNFLTQLFLHMWHFTPKVEKLFIQPQNLGQTVQSEQLDPDLVWPEHVTFGLTTVTLGEGGEGKMSWKSWIGSPPYTPILGFELPVMLLGFGNNYFGIDTSLYMWPDQQVWTKRLWLRNLKIKGLVWLG